MQISIDLQLKVEIPAIAWFFIPLFIWRSKKHTVYIPFLLVSSLCMSHAFDQNKQVPRREVFKQIGVGTKKAQALFQAADSDQDGVIQVHEFIAWLTQQRLKAKVNKHQET